MTVLSSRGKKTFTLYPGQTFPVSVHACCFSPSCPAPHRGEPHLSLLNDLPTGTRGAVRSPQSCLGWTSPSPSAAPPASQWLLLNSFQFIGVFCVLLGPKTRQCPNVVQRVISRGRESLSSICLCMCSHSPGCCCLSLHTAGLWPACYPPGPQGGFHNVCQLFFSFPILVIID